jgi:very-short-patch-repair endonuclease
MPGGSGLLQQIIERWSEVVESGRRLLASCVGACPKSCQDCLRNYYNQAFHDLLDRHRALRVLDAYAKVPQLLNEIPPAVEQVAPRRLDDTNLGERVLEARIKEWGFTKFEAQVTVKLPRISTYTIPDLADPTRKIAIYLDGPDHYIEPRRSRDAVLRAELEELGWAVLDLDVKDAENPAILDRLRRGIGRVYSSKSTDV